MNILAMYFKKIKTYRGRLVFAVIIFSLCVFASCLILSVGFNYVAEMKYQYTETNSFRCIYAEKSMYDDSELSMDAETMLGLNPWFRTDLQVEAIGDTEVVLKPFVMRVNEAFCGSMVAGKPTLSDRECLLGTNILDYLKIDYKTAIGRQVLLSDSTCRTIVGVYDNSEEYISEVIIGSDHVNDAFSYLISAKDTKQVNSIAEKLKKDGYVVKSQGKSIAEGLHYFRIVSIMLMFALVICVALSTMILFFVLSQSIRDMEPFFAILKAMGYNHQKCSLLLYSEVFLVWLSSCVLSAGLYYLGIALLRTISSFMKLAAIRFVAVETLVQPNGYILLTGVLLSLVGVIVIGIIKAHEVNRLQVGELLCEANQ